MQTSVLFALLAAAAVSAHNYEEQCNKTEYKGEPACTIIDAPVYKEKLPTYRKYDCDATATECYAPATYGDAYKKTNYGYKYGKHYKYPGPKVRFCNGLRKLKKKAGDIAKGVVKVVVGVIGFGAGIIIRVWKAFVHKWNKWCEVARSDWDRFADWKACKKEEWKDWWEHYLDLCRTRKALWDDAMREFHRQWHHYKKCADSDYEKHKKEKCHIKEDDYDDKEDYTKNVNYFGATPVEISYKPDIPYKPAEYKATCKKRDDKYKEKYGDAPADVPDTEYVK
jgi:hypothetical protein